MADYLYAYAQKSDAELRFIVKDASEAAIAMRGVSMEAEYKYLDQVNDATTILARRARSKSTAFGTARSRARRGPLHIDGVC